MVPLWIVAQAAAVAMLERRELRGDDFTGQNQKEIRDLRSMQQQYQRNTSTRINQVENSFEQNFRGAISTITEKLEQIARSMAQAETSFQSTLNVKDPLKGTDKTITAAAMAAQKAAAVAERELSKIQTTFTKEAAKTTSAWGKKEVAQVQKYMKEIAKTRKALLKETQTKAKEIAKLGSKTADDTIKLEKQADKSRDKYEDKLSKVRNKLEDEIEKTDDHVADSEGRIENLAADTEGVIESEDPEKPGATYKLQEGSEKVEEVREEAGDELEYMAGENAEEMKYGEEDIQDAFAETAETLVDNGEKYTEHIGEAGAALRKAIQKATVANHGAQATFETNVNDEFAKAEALTVQLEELQDRVEQYKDVMHESLETMVEHAVSQLEKVMEENQNSFEGKAEGVYQYVASASSVQKTKAQSHVEKVRQAFLAEVQQAADQAEAYTNQAKGQLKQATDSLQVAMDKMTKVQATIATQDKDKQQIPAHATQIEIAANSLMSAESKAHTTVQAQAKAQTAHVDELDHKAEQDMANAFGEVLTEVNTEAMQDSQAISDTAGVAAERLNSMLTENTERTNSLKGDVETADYALSATQRMLAKAYKLLQAVPEQFTSIGSRTTEALRDAAYEAEKWSKDMEDPIKEATKKTMAKNEQEFNGVQGAVEGAQEASAERIGKQADDLNKMIDDTRADMASQRQIMQNRRAMISQELGSLDENAKADARRMAEDLAQAKHTYDEHSAGHANNLLKQKQMFQGITDNTTATGAAIIAQFQTHVGDALGDYSKSVLETSKHADVAVLEAKKAIQAATQKDTLEFRRAAMKLTTKLEDNFNLQAKLKKGTLNTAGGDAVGVAGESLAQVDAAQRAVASLIEKMQSGIERIAGKANDKINAAVTQHDSDRSALSLGLKQQLAELSNEQRKSHSQFKARMGMVHQNFETMQSSMVQSMDGMNQELVGQDRKTAEAAAVASQGIRVAQGKVDQDWRNSMVQEEAWIQQHGAEAEREAMETRAVEMQAERQAASLDKEVSRAEQAAHDHIDALGPGDKTTKLTAEVGALSQLFHDEVKKTTKLEDEAEGAAQRLSTASEQDVAAANMRLAALAPGIAKESQRRDEYFQKLEDEQNATHLDIQNALDELVELGVDMKSAMANKGLDVQRHMRDVEEEVAQMQEMTKYASGNELDRIKDALQVGTNETNDILSMVDDEVRPKTKDLRKRIGQVYEGLGVSLDLDKVAEMANSTMQEELSQRQRLVGARAEIEEELHTAARATQAALNEVYEKTKHLIEQVSRMDHLSEAEKAHKIREIKAAAARQTAAIMAKARADIQGQMTSAHKMDEREQELAVLLARAKSLSSGEFQTTDKATLAKQLDETKNKIQATRDKWVNPFSSLLQEAGGDEEKGDEPWTPGAELHQDLMQAENLATHRAEEDSQLERELDQLRAVGS